MDREPQDTLDLLDLGAASVETRGADEGDFDVVGMIPRQTLSQD
ncbi:benenodin family lasso peptide [Sphingomonas sp. CJ20]